MILAIDQSTSATKAVLFDDAGRAIDKASRPHKQHYPRPGWVEHDAAEIWANGVAVARDLADRHDLATLAGVSLANQRETVVVFDRATGEPLHPAIVWQCHRGDAIVRQLLDAGHGPLVAGRSGLKLDSYFSAPKLKWLVGERPELAARLRDGTACIGTIDAYLVHRMTGGKTFATDATNASRTLLFDLGARRWDDELCALFDVPKRALPEVRDSDALYGETTLAGALPRAVPIRGVIGDSQASLFARRSFAPGDAKATFGTGTSVLVNTGDARPTITGGSVAALAWVIAGRPTYALEGIINYSAATLAWLKDQLGTIRDFDEVEPLAASVPDNGGVYLVPAFTGLSAPYWSDAARAAIVGMSAHTTRAHVVRAAVESIAYQVRDVLDTIRQDAPAPIVALAADGGPTRNTFLMQLVADVARVELHVADVPEASALGAAFLGMLGLGIHELASLAALPRDAAVYRPRLDAATADAWHAGWLAAVRRVL